MIADPQGAVLALFRPEGEGPRPAPMSQGSVGWNELMAADMPAVWPFYAAMFDWTKGEALEMGPMGTYQLFAANDAVVGGMTTRPPGARARSGRTTSRCPISMLRWYAWPREAALC